MEDTKLDKQLIIDTALEIMRDDGIDGLTMRKLGARLNVRAPTLYWYFPDRATIIRTVIKMLLVETIESVAHAATWQEWFQQFGEALWQTNSDTPFVTMLLQSAEFNNDEIFDLAIELIDKSLEPFGLERTMYMRIHSDIQALVLGWAVFLQAGVTGRVQAIIDVDSSVREGIRGIIQIWSIRSGTM
ncbi:MAG: TetR family transcriptional regulator [Novosphingobium lindaniclasticum]|jgi:TetR/AcrR family tetracycline transcriptional repressor|uniref:TetR/AcrR family transcriptional regulator n=1 Tax=Novosphingobium lindaniclasticum TaxID=1329895 RepID=UPI00240A1B08|nr:TetR/AcrR family transcriptional regulator [Novosphingobium lindaniclasticum]MDF2638459.1 TetR family transcriptional regulator [Novosphingobium lindaniclasticum]